ncbi:MAG: ATP phosphoribosyltransferase [Leptospiraceae bacterium]|nr:ATP phosphoribosyltransferase [Leptospiraceae bacterium]MCP5510275.1 ATP phosphoribosyltransferase [Leptospiraceae bacterium]
MLTLALPKGRLADDSIQLLIRKNWLEDKPNDKSKELKFLDPLGKLNILLVRAQDVPTYVTGQAADAGIVGFDVIKEGNYDLVYPLDLGIGKCRLSIAGNPGFDLKKHLRKLRVATKYPGITREYFFSKGMSCEIIKLYGSIELAPLCGLADCIVDIVESGETLKANGLVEYETILQSSARLVINRSSLYTGRSELIQLIKDLEIN